jgi:hypothetical protein
MPVYHFSVFGHEFPEGAGTPPARSPDSPRLPEGPCVIAYSGAAPGAEAGSLPGLFQGFAGRALPAAGAWLSRERGAFPSRRCPSGSLLYEAFFPQGLDGGGPVDRAIGAFASSLLAWTSGLAADPALPDGRPGPCAVRHCGIAYRSSRSASSVAGALFVSEAGFPDGPGAWRGPLWRLSVNLLPDGSELSARGLFPDPGASLPRLWEAVWRGFCAQGRGSAPVFYGSPPCGGAPPRPPQGFQEERGGLDGLGHALVTSLGITVALVPDEAWGRGLGPAHLDIAKEELVAMGAEPGLWR